MSSSTSLRKRWTGAYAFAKLWRCSPNPVVVAWQLGTGSIVGLLTAAIATLAAIPLIRFRVHSAWLVMGGGTVELVASVVRPG